MKHLKKSEKMYGIGELAHVFVGLSLRGVASVENIQNLVAFSGAHYMQA